ncbi:hypothetical protein CPB84DRAFT_1771280 [Gymnopilus junonius]|uniref:Coilin n=1 Tax=Gymnopilus junonius TaxID=109634 RepID=A0A9P5NVD6_GYMJU|nr:hypothetical protein CPB84DRAFT_1771280 [Gymnopilus junonius]
MRLRIQTQPPLPELKAWFIPDVPSAPTTMYELKEALCQRVQPLADSGRCEARHLVLLLDEFELLDETPFSAVRDGDLLVIKLSPDQHVAVRGHKRKRTESPQRPVSVSFPAQSIKKPRAGPSAPQEESSSDSDSDSESEESSSGSSSDSGSVTHVPPGQGKPSTHSRNKRRKKKLQSEKALLAAPAPPKGVSATNAIPIGSTATSTKATVKKPSALMPKSTSVSASTSHPPVARSTPSSQVPSIAAASIPVPSTSSSSTTILPTPISTPTTTAATTTTAIATATTVTLTTTTPTTIPPPAHPPLKKRLKHTQRDRAGPASDVAFALNQAFGWNAAAGEYIPGDTRDFEEDEDDDDSDDDEREVIDVDALESPAKAKDQKAHREGYTHISIDQIMMGSLRNKNKRKGFKQSMEGLIPQKIVFSDLGGGNDSLSLLTYPTSTSTSTTFPAQAQAPTPARTGNGNGPQTRPRLVPPSEIQSRGELPPRVFVTSVDVEAGMWGEDNADDAGDNSTQSQSASGKKSKNKNKNKNRKKRTMQYEEYQDYVHGHVHDQRQGQGQDRAWENDADADQDQDQDQDQVEASLVLEYPPEEEAESASATKVNPTKVDFDANSAIDWARAERMHDSEREGGSKRVRGADELVLGGVVGWKELGIDPTTFTPENIFYLARIVKVSTPTPLPTPPAPSSTPGPSSDAPAAAAAAPSPPTKDANAVIVTIKRIQRPRPVDLEESAGRAAVAFGLLDPIGVGGGDDDIEGGDVNGKEEEGRQQQQQEEEEEEEEEEVEWNESLQWRVLEL